MNILILLLYGCIFFLSLACYKQLTSDYSKKYSNVSVSSNYFIFVLFAFISFCCVFSFPYIGTGVKDMFVYKISFEAQKYHFSFRSSLFNQSQEPLYSFLVFIASKIMSFRFFLFCVYSFIFLAVKYYIEQFTEKCSKIFFLSFVICYFSLLITSFCLLRMVFATSIGIFSLKQIEKKEWIKSLLIIVLAVGIHFTAIFFVFPLFLGFVYARWRNFFGTIFLLSLFLGITFAKSVNLILPSFNARYSSYQQSGLSFSLFAMKSYLLNIIFLFFIWLKKQTFFRINVSVHFYVFLSSLYIMELQSAVGMLHRMVIYTIPSVVIVLSRLFEVYKTTRRCFLTSLFVRFLVLFYLAYYLYKFFTVDCNAYGLWAFKLFYFD